MKVKLKLVIFTIFLLLISIIFILLIHLYFNPLGLKTDGQVDIPKSQKIYEETEICIHTGTYENSGAAGFVYTLKCDETKREDIHFLYPGSRKFLDFDVIGRLTPRSCQDISLFKKGNNIFLEVSTDILCLYLDSGERLEKVIYQVDAEGQIINVSK